MGCSQSRLDDEEAVQLCKDRKEFIKQALEQRTRFASGHIAYIESLQKVSAALRDYIGDVDDEPHELFLNSFTKTFTPTVMKVEPSSAALKVNYLRPSGNPVVSVAERVQSPEMGQVEEYSPMNQFGIDGFLAMDSSFFSNYSPNNRPNLPPPSPQASQWDFFWNPFTSLDYYGYGYPTRCSHGQVVVDDETRGENGIPDLEEDETEPENGKRYLAEETTNVGVNSSIEAMVEDDDDEVEYSQEYHGKRYLAEERTNVGVNSSMEAMVEDDDDDDDEDEEEEVEYSQEYYGSASFELSKAQTSGHLESSHKEIAVGNQDGNEEKPAFTVYVDRRPTSIAEVIRDLEAQLKVVSNATNEVSEFLQAKKARYLLTTNDQSGLIILPSNV